MQNPVLITVSVLLLSCLGATLTGCSDDDESANSIEARQNRAAILGYWQIVEVVFDEMNLRIDDRSFYNYTDNNRFFIIRDVPPGVSPADDEHILNGSWRIEDANPNSLAIFDLNDDIRDFSTITELTDSSLVLTTRERTNTGRDVDRITRFEKFRE